MSVPGLAPLRVQDRGVEVAWAAAGLTPAQRRRSTRWGLLFAVVWLTFFAPVVRDAWALEDRVAAWGALAVVAAFLGVYLAVFATMRRGIDSAGRPLRGPAGLAVVALLTGLGVVLVATVGESGAVAAFFVAVVSVIVLPIGGAVAVVVVLSLATALLSRVPGYEAWGNTWIFIVLPALSMWGVTQLMDRNAALLRARAENERLVLEAERHRMARDLHDILGHSLTVITVKSELAGAMLDAGSPAALERARAEVADLERLARDALADVRATAHGYRDVSLPGELARAGEALRAAGIAADLPGAADAVPTELRELFAWTVREGVTNVVRHSGARRCEVVLEPGRVVVRDDGACSDAGAGPSAVTGAGPGTGTAPAEDGAGLVGLRERAAAVGASVAARRDEHGFVLEVLA